MTIGILTQRPARLLALAVLLLLGAALLPGPVRAEDCPDDNDLPCPPDGGVSAAFTDVRSALVAYVPQPHQRTLVQRVSVAEGLYRAIPPNPIAPVAVLRGVDRDVQGLACRGVISAAGAQVIRSRIHTLITLIIPPNPILPTDPIRPCA